MVLDRVGRVPSLEKIGRFVGYQPEVSLGALLEITIRDVREQMSMRSPAGLSSSR